MFLSQDVLVNCCWVHKMFAHSTNVIFFHLNYLLLYLMSHYQPQIRTQMCLGTNWWYERLILGWFEQPGSTYCKKTLMTIMSNFWDLFFDIFIAKKINLEYCSVPTKKLHRVKVKESWKILGSIYYGGKTMFFRAKNFNVSTKTL